MPAPRAYIFDLDRTLVDLQSFTDYAAALRDLTAMIGAHPGAMVPDADWDAPTQSTMAILVALTGDPRWPTASEAVAVHERAAIPRSLPMIGLHELVEACEGRPYAVVTLLAPDVARDVLDFHGFPVDVIIGRDPRIRAKPHGDGLVVAAERLGVGVPECVMIGDSTWDHAAAMEAGASFIGVPMSVSAFAPEIPQAHGLLDAMARASRGERLDVKSTR